MRIDLGVKKKVFARPGSSTSSKNDVKDNEYAFLSTPGYEKPRNSVLDILTCQRCGLVSESQYLLGIHQARMCWKRLTDRDERAGQYFESQGKLFRLPRKEATTSTMTDVTARGKPYAKPLKVVYPQSSAEPTAKQAKRQLKYKCFFCPYVTLSLDGRATHVEQMHPANVTQAPSLPVPRITMEERLRPNPTPQMVSLLATAGFDLLPKDGLFSCEVLDEGLADFSAHSSMKPETSRFNEDPSEARLFNVEVKEEIEIKEEEDIVILPDQEVFLCRLCPEIFSSADEQHLHEKDHFGTRDLDITTLRDLCYRCTRCWMVFGTNREAELHTLVHAVTPSSSIYYAQVIAAIAIYNHPQSGISFPQICAFSSKYFNSLHDDRFKFQDALADVLKDKAIFTTTFVIKANEEGDLEQQAIFGLNEKWRRRRLPGLLEAFGRETKKYLEMPALRWMTMKAGQLNWLKDRFL